MSFTAAVRSAYARYATFSGRASRPEYWWFVLFFFVAGAILSAVESVLFGHGPEDTAISASLFQLASFIPFLAVGWRRLHDTGRPGWYLLVPTAIGIAIVLASAFGVAGFGTLLAPGDGPEVLAPAAGAGGFLVLLFALALQVAASVVLIVMLAKKGEAGPNAWGDPPA